jgi:hypothetical protein
MTLTQEKETSAGELIGWRTDGSGSYPKAHPPLEWSPTKNVVWSTPMPGYGVSHPVLLGRRIFAPWSEYEQTPQ